MSEAITIHPTLARVQRAALMVGLAGSALAIFGLFTNKDQFFHSYLFAFMFWIGLPLGSLALLMLQHMTGGQWGLVIRRPLESSTRMLPFMVLLFLPLLASFNSNYIWARDPNSNNGHQPYTYLTVHGWEIRAAIYFAIWIILIVLLNVWSSEEDRRDGPSEKLARRFRLLSGPGLAIYGITISLAVVDWVMSVDPHWYSTIYGLLFIVGQVLSTLSMSVVLLAIIGDRPPYSQILVRSHFHDLGNLMFAFTMLWAYISFSQFLIIWSGNISEETPFYYYRTGNGWQALALGLVIFHFFVPFLLLLWRRTKRTPRFLATLAIFIVLMRFCDLYWVITPAYFQPHEESKAVATHVQNKGDGEGEVAMTTLGELHLKTPAKRDADFDATFNGTASSMNPDGPKVVPAFTISWMDFVLPIAIGGIWIAVYIWQLGRRPLIPRNDLRLATMGGGH